LAGSISSVARGSTGLRRPSLEPGISRSRHARPAVAPRRFPAPAGRVVHSFCHRARGCVGPRRVRCALAFVLQQVCQGSGWTKLCGTSGSSPSEPRGVCNLMNINMFFPTHRAASSQRDLRSARCSRVGLLRTPASYGRLRSSADGAGDRKDPESYPQFGSACGVDLGEQRSRFARRPWGTPQCGLAHRGLRGLGRTQRPSRIRPCICVFRCVSGNPGCGWDSAYSDLAVVGGHACRGSRRKGVLAGGLRKSLGCPCRTWKGPKPAMFHVPALFHVEPDPAGALFHVEPRGRARLVPRGACRPPRSCRT
jgi:hypothetical protein